MTTSIASIFRSVTPAAMRHFAAACRESDKPNDVPSYIAEQILGAPLVLPTLTALREMAVSGWSSDQVAFLLEQMSQDREAINAQDASFDLVLSGPELDRVDVRDTFAVVNELFVRARKEVILVGYAVHNGHVLFQRLAERLECMPSLRVRMYLNISRRTGDTSLSDQIIGRFAHDFFTRHWPWNRRPELYYDVRSLSEPPEPTSSLHAKCVIVDRSAVLVTSANFTAAAQERNIEVGTLIEHAPSAMKLVTYLEGLSECGTIRPLPSRYISR